MARRRLLIEVDVVHVHPARRVAPAVDVVERVGGDVQRVCPPERTAAVAAARADDDHLGPRGALLLVEHSESLWVITTDTQGRCRLRVLRVTAR